MIQLIYTSTVAPQIESGEIFRIVNKSAANNGRDGLSGFLLLSKDRFFQVVEGPEAAIDALMRKLEADPRHHSITIVERKTIERPSFPSWRMKRLHAELGTNAPDQIDPHLKSVPQNVLDALVRFLASQGPSIKAA